MPKSCFVLFFTKFKNNQWNWWSITSEVNLDMGITHTEKILPMFKNTPIRHRQLNSFFCFFWPFVNIWYLTTFNWQGIEFSSLPQFKWGRRRKNYKHPAFPHSILQKYILHYMWCLATSSLTTWPTFPWWFGNIENVLSLNPQGLYVFMWKSMWSPWRSEAIQALLAV